MVGIESCGFLIHEVVSLFQPLNGNVKGLKHNLQKSFPKVKLSNANCPETLETAFSVLNQLSKVILKSCHNKPRQVFFKNQII